jgi:hypothetical protein
MTLAVTTVFTNNRTQAVRLPAEARLPDDVKRVMVRVRVESALLRRSKIRGITFSYMVQRYLMTL